MIISMLASKKTQRNEIWQQLHGHQIRLVIWRDNSAFVNTFEDISCKIRLTWVHTLSLGEHVYLCRSGGLQGY